MFQIYRTSSSTGAQLISRSDHPEFERASGEVTVDDVRSFLRNVAEARRTAALCEQDVGDGGEYEEPVSRYLAACLALYYQTELKAVQRAGLLGTLEMVAGFHGAPSMRSVINDAAKDMILENVPLNVISLLESLRSLDDLIIRYSTTATQLAAPPPGNVSLGTSDDILPWYSQDPTLAEQVEIFKTSPITTALMDAAVAGDSFATILNRIATVDGFEMDDDRELFVNPSLLDDIIGHGPANQRELIATVHGDLVLQVPSFDTPTGRSNRNFDKTKVLNDLNKTRVPQADHAALLDALLIHGSTSPQFETATRKIERIFRSGSPPSSFGHFDMQQVFRSVVGQTRPEFSSRLLVPTRVADAVQGKLPDGQRRLSSIGKSSAPDSAVSRESQWYTAMATVLLFSDKEEDIFIYEATTELTDAVQIVSLTSRKMVQVIVDALKEIVRPESKEFKRLIDMQNKGTGPLHESVILDWIRHGEDLLDQVNSSSLFDVIPEGVAITPEFVVAASADRNIFAYESMLQKMRMDTPAFRNQEYLRQVINCGSVLSQEIPKHVTPGTGAEIIKLFCQMVASKTPWNELDCPELYHITKESAIPGQTVGVPWAVRRDVITAAYAMKSSTRMATFGHLYLSKLPYTTIKDRIENFGIDGFAEWFASVCKDIEKTPGYAGGSKDGVCNPTKNSQQIHKSIEAFRDLGKKIHTVTATAGQHGLDSPSAHAIMSLSIQGDLAGIAVIGDVPKENPQETENGSAALGAGHNGFHPERVKGYETILALKKKLDSATNLEHVKKHVENYNSMLKSRKDFESAGLNCRITVNSAGAVTTTGLDHTSTVEQFNGLSPFSQGALDAHRDLARTNRRWLSEMGVDLYKKIKASDGNLPKGWGKITITNQRGKERYSVPAAMNKAFLTTNTTDTTSATPDVSSDDTPKGSKKRNKNKRNKDPKGAEISKERLAAFEKWESDQHKIKKEKEEDAKADAMAGRFAEKMMETLMERSNSTGEGYDGKFINSKPHSNSE